MTAIALKNEMTIASMEKAIEYSVIVPVYNAETTLEELCHRISLVFSELNYSYEIILVDDGSSDKSWEMIGKIKNNSPETIRGIRLAKNFGQHNATLCGIVAAGGRDVLTIDEDLQAAPESIVKLISLKMETGADLIYGVFPDQKHGFIRKTMSRFYKLISKIDKESNGRGSSFRLINNDLKEKIRQHLQYYIFIDEICLWYTSKIRYVNVPHHSSKNIRSGYSAARLTTLTSSLILYSSDIPLRLMIYCGLTFSGVNALIGIYFLFKKFLRGVPVPGYTSTLLAILFSTGIIMFCMGIVGIYLMKIYRLLNHQPPFNISERI